MLVSKRRSKSFQVFEYLRAVQTVRSGISGKTIICSDNRPANNKAFSSAGFSGERRFSARLIWQRFPAICPHAARPASTPSSPSATSEPALPLRTGTPPSYFFA
jgi:hypothetical protein